MNKWTTAYEEDAKLRAAMDDLRQGKKNEYTLTPIGLLMMKAGKKEKIVVPTNMKQDVLRECHDILVVGRVRDGRSAKFSLTAMTPLLFPLIMTH